ncbi:MAG: ClbS/DfsB family four-helix bundle protein [Oscillospiraceae bacterium]|nr:ClbS/DfsB family four-helix bundle protein [Oscillospiraceae bacterium]
MQEYTSKAALIDEIRKTAGLFIKEFDDVADADKDLRFDGVDRTPGEIIPYQLGWMGLIRSWDKDELLGKEVVTPAPGYKWNQMGELYQEFYDKYKDEPLSRLKELFVTDLDSFIDWLSAFSDNELFKPGSRKWAASTPSNWPIWKWVHINTVAPFKSFRSKIRKWKKLRTGV